MKELRVVEDGISVASAWYLVIESDLERVDISSEAVSDDLYELKRFFES